MRNLTISLVVAIALMGGFYTGFKYEKSKVPETTASPAAFAGAGGTGTGTGGTGRGNGGGTAASPAPGATGAGGGGFGGRGTFGQIVSINGNTITIKDAQGAEVKVQLQSSTTITKTVAASTTDLAQGVNITVAGQRGSDGTVTATSISIVPAGAGPRTGG